MKDYHSMLCVLLLAAAIPALPKLVWPAHSDYQAMAPKVPLKWVLTGTNQGYPVYQIVGIKLTGDPKVDMHQP